MLFSVRARLKPWQQWILMGVLPLILIGWYMYAAYVRHQANPDDKIVPYPTQVGLALWHSLIGEPGAEPSFIDRLSAIWNGRLIGDTLASGGRFLIALAIVSIGGVLHGVNVAALPVFRAMFETPWRFMSKLPALALLPLLMVSLGIGEGTKIWLIVIGTWSTVVLDTVNLASNVPPELITKAWTLGASNFEVVYRVILPYVMPSVLNTIRLNLIAMLLFLIAGEQILPSSDGLGYRIFKLQKFLANDQITAYVIWIGLLLFLMDLAIRLLSRWWFPWAQENQSK